jgi:group I intron endonuclease
MIGIYKITNPNGFIYIGQSKDIQSRILAYKRSKCKGQPKLHASFLEYGVNAHIFEIECLCEEKELHAMEVYYIQLYNSFISGLNSKDEINPLPFKQKSKDERLELWKQYLDTQLIKYNKRDFKREKRIKMLKYNRTKLFRF